MQHYTVIGRDRYAFNSLEDAQRAKEIEAIYMEGLDTFSYSSYSVQFKVEDELDACGIQYKII